MVIFYQILFLILTYLICAIPFGLVITKKFAKKDIRDLGSKNIGATNVARVAGKKLGFITLILDGAKGWVMVTIARFYFCDISNLHLFLVLVATISVLAHIYPIYLRFKGGKGVATSIAVLFALDTYVGLIASCFWLLSFCLFHISSVSSIIAIFSAAIFSLQSGAPTIQIAFCWFLFILILIRHKENLTRLSRGDEKKL